MPLRVFRLVGVAPVIKILSSVIKDLRSGFKSFSQLRDLLVFYFFPFHLHSRCYGYFLNLPSQLEDLLREVSASGSLLAAAEQTLGISSRLAELREQSEAW